MWFMLSDHHLPRNLPFIDGVVKEFQNFEATHDEKAHTFEECKAKVQSIYF